MKKSKASVATDERRSKQMENNELEFALSVFIGVNRRPDCFFQHPAKRGGDDNAYYECLFTRIVRDANDDPEQ